MSGWTKNKRESFFKKVHERSLILPRTLIKQDFRLFDEEAEDKYVHMLFLLTYPDVDDTNPNNDPVAKQSFRNSLINTSERIGTDFSGKAIYKQRIHGYQDAKIVHVSECLSDQIKFIIEEEYPAFVNVKFTKEVHITRFECIFSPLLSFNKKKRDLIDNDQEIFFKTTKPDFDNIEKLVWDALQDSGLIHNDAMICSKNGFLKRYGNIPGVIIELELEK